MNLSDTLPQRPTVPADLTPESVAAYKAQLRRWDSEVISTGKMTPEQLRLENSILPPAKSYRILNMKEVCERHGQEVPS